MKRARLLARDILCSSILGILGLITVLGIPGCAGGDPPTAKTSGSVSFNGKPVPGGEVILAPVASGNSMPGKTAVSQVDFDGTFTVTTYKEGDGAIIGKHTVKFNPPTEEPKEAAPGEHVASRPSPYAGLVPKEKEIEITAGEENTLNIELVPAEKK